MKIRTKTIVLRFVTLLLFCGLFIPLIAQDVAKPTLFETLLRDDALEMHIKTDLKTLIKKKAKKEKHVADLTYKNADGSEAKWTIKIRARGNMRNKTCFLPPLKIDFVKADLTNAGIIEEYDDLKLVVHCKNSDNYDEFVLREYLAYKMYNLFTDISFKVQLVKLTLEDTQGKQKPIVTSAFLIENDDEMAARLKGRVIESKYAKQDILHPELFDKMCLFQYMIGNTDWYILNKHNVKVLRVGDYKRPVAVPYDFDYAGMVGTPYAVVNEKLPFEDVKQRFYLGACRNPGTLDPLIQEFKENKEAVLTLCELEIMNEKSRKATRKYLEGFFEILENPKQCKREIVDHCDQYIKVN